MLASIRCRSRPHCACANIGAMSVSPSAVPAAVTRLGPDAVIEALVRHGTNVTDAASDPGVPSADLHKLLWANPGPRDRADEVIERRLDLAEKNVGEALQSEDSRRKDAASFFVVRNTARAKRRGWITSASASVDMSVNANAPPQRIIISWLNPDDVDDPDDEKLIEHEASPEPSNKE